MRRDKVSQPSRKGVRSAVLNGKGNGLSLASLLLTLVVNGYGVVVCPNCRWPKGVDLSTRTSRCTRCSRSLRLQRLKVWEKVGVATELPEAVGKVAEQLQAGLDPRELPTVEDLITQRPQARDLEETLERVDREREMADSQTTLDPLSLALRGVTTSGARSKWDRTVQLVRELGRQVDMFSEDQIETGLVRLGILELQDIDAVGLADRDRIRQENERSLGKWLKRLTEANLIYSPQAGVYRLI